MVFQTFFSPSVRPGWSGGVLSVAFSGQRQVFLVFFSQSASGAVPGMSELRASVCSLEPWLVYLTLLKGFKGL